MPNRSKGRGRYRAPAVGKYEAYAYVQNGNIANFVTETRYREAGYEPPFETLPTEDEWKQKKGDDA
jgi:hypothetical protein